MRKRVAIRVVLVVGIGFWLALRPRSNPSPADAPAVEPSASSTSPGAVAATPRSPSSPLPDRGSAPAGAGKPVRIDVVDPDGIGIAGAEVHAGTGESATRLGTTDAAGTFETSDLDRGASTTISARAKGYREASSTLVAPAARVRLVLAWNATICGHVKTADGSSAGKGVLVIARDVTRSTLDEAAILHAIRQEAADGARVARTDDGGGFCVSGLKPTSKYDLIAAGNGFASRPPPPPRPPSDEDVTLTVGCAYGCAFRYIETGGTPIRTAPEIRGAFVSIAPGRNAIAAGTRSVQTMLSLAWLRGACDLAPEERPIIVISETCADALTIPVTVKLPGYERSRKAVVLPRLVAEPPTQEFELTPTARGFGDLDVEIVGLEGDDSHGPDDGLGIVQIASDEAEYVVSLTRGDAPLRRIRGIPFGRYRVSFSTTSGVVVGSRKEGPRDRR